ncbi:Rv1733c family protein [Nocardia sp. NPDC003963]
MVSQPNRYPTTATRLWHLRPWRESPLLRPGDRLIGWLVCSALLVTGWAIPIAAAVGTHAHEALSESAAERAAGRHRVPATLRESAPFPSEYDLYPVTAATWIADGTQHTGSVYAPAGYRRGEVVDIWVDRDGEHTAAPPNASSVLFDSILISVFTWSGPVLLYCLPAAIAIGRIRSRQLDHWNTEWARLHAGF